MMSAARVTSVTSLDAASRASDTSGSARLGLPIRITLSYVSKEFRLGNTEGFRSSGLSRTDWTGRGVDGITAQVSIPDYLPLYGSVALAGYPISVRVSENCLERPETFLAIMAHELSHVLLRSLCHPLP